jgi:hypothetical protein
MDRFLNAIKADLEGTASFVEAGCDDERQVYAIAAAITNMIAAAKAQTEAEEDKRAA